MDDCGSGPYCPGQPLAAPLTNLKLPGATTGISMNADYSCTQRVSDVVNPDGTVKPGMANSPCLATVPISSRYIDQNGGVNIPIVGYATVFLAAYEKHDEILAIQFVKNVQVQSDVTAYNPLGSFAIRLIG